MFEQLSFLERFEIASEIIGLNKKYSFGIVDTVFFLLNKKLNHLTETND